MNTKQLRQKILDLAIRGKLVPQDPNDEPASVLLERIKAEKEKLIKEGKIKRSKKSATTADKPHYPFEIPSNWVWCNLNNVAQVFGRIGFRGYTKNDLVDSNGAITLSPSNIIDGKMDYTNYKLISWEKYKESPEIMVFNGDILLVKTGSSYGKCAIVSNLPREATINPQFVILKYVQCNSKYLTYVLQSSYARNIFDDFVLGTAIPTFTQVALENMLIPLPPLNEQDEIVIEIDNLLSLVNGLINTKKELTSNIKLVKSKILELAISGKLVPQDPADEPAEELLRRINPSAVPADKSHYQHLPQNWCTCKLEDIVDYEQPQRYIVESTDYNDTYKTPVLTAGKSFLIGHTNETAGIFNNLPVIIFDDFTTDSKYVDFPFKVKSSAMKILHVRRGINIKYVYYFMSITRLVGKTHKRYWISEYSKLHIPLPPYNEQCRIVAAIENISQRIDDILEVL